MDVASSIKKLKGELESMSNTEAELRGRIAELNGLVQQKKQKLESIAKLKKDEEELLKQLEL